MHIQVHFILTRVTLLKHEKLSVSNYFYTLKQILISISVFCIVLFFSCSLMSTRPCTLIHPLSLFSPAVLHPFTPQEVICILGPSLWARQAKGYTASNLRNQIPTGRMYIDCFRLRFLSLNSLDSLRTNSWWFYGNLGPNLNRIHTLKTWTDKKKLILDNHLKANST